MEDCKREIKHIILAQFKDDVSEEQIEEWSKKIANLVDLVPSMKSFTCGKELGIANLNEGFGYVFESTFESAEGVAEYIAHPAHVDIGNLMMPYFVKFVVVNFETAKAKVQS